MTARRPSPSGSAAASSPDGWRAYRTALVATAVLVLLLTVFGVLLATASSSSALGRLRSHLGSAAEQTRDALTVSEATPPPTSSPTPTPDPALDPAQAAAVARSRAAVPVANALIDKITLELDAGSTQEALTDFGLLVEQLKVIQPRDGRGRLDVAAAALRNRLSSLVATPTP